MMELTHKSYLYELRPGQRRLSCAHATNIVGSDPKTWETPRDAWLRVERESLRLVEKATKSPSE